MAPLCVDLATLNDEKGTRYERDPMSYVWQQGASVVSESLVTGTEPRINAEHALHALEVMEAARKYQEKGMRVNLTSKFHWPMVR